MDIVLRCRACGAAAQDVLRLIADWDEFVPGGLYGWMQQWAAEHRCVVPVPAIMQRDGRAAEGRVWVAPVGR